MKNKGWIIGAAIVFIFCAAGFRVWQSIKAFSDQERARDVFLPYVTDYAEAPVTPGTDTGAYAAGKIVTVDVARKVIDPWTYPKLSGAVRARTPEEVGTVVRIQWDREKTGDYQNTETGTVTGEAFRSKALVTVIDWKDRTRVAETVFLGEPPAGGLSREGDYESLQPMFEIVKYLEALPRR